MLAVGIVGTCLMANAEEITLSSNDSDTQLLELFTSQGCSSCPPAEKWVTRLKDDPELWKAFVPVVYHVDYWDYLGWKDPFAKKRFSTRQRSYRLQSRINSVYTPGFVLDGNEWRGWFKGDSLPSLSPINPSPNFTATVDGNQVEVTLQGSEQNTYQVHLALLAFDIATKVTRGENAGRTLKSDFVAIEVNEQPIQSQAAHFTLSTNRADKQRYAIAIWLTQDDPLKPVAVVGGWL